MVFASRYPGEIKEMEGYGWKGATEGKFDWKVFLENKNQVCYVVLLFVVVDVLNNGARKVVESREIPSFRLRRGNLSLWNNLLIPVGWFCNQHGPSKALSGGDISYHRQS